MAKYNVMTLLVNNREDNAPKLQEELTSSGCIIKTRLGLPGFNGVENICSNEGLIILELVGDDKQIYDLEASLNKINGISAKNIQLSNDEN